jgi:hypothetical protein
MSLITKCMQSLAEVRYSAFAPRFGLTLHLTAFPSLVCTYSAPGLSSPSTLLNMLAYLGLAIGVLPLSFAVPVGVSGGLKDIAAGDGTGIGNLLGQPVGAVLPIDQIVKGPTNIVEDVNVVVGNILPRRVDSETQYNEVLDNIRSELVEANEISATFAGLFQSIVRAYVPQSIPEALGELEKVLGNGSTAVTLENVGLAILSGLSTADLTQNVLAGYLSGINSFNNNNPPVQQQIYPQKSASDAGYTVPESQLRSALYIPPTFTGGHKRPILFVPGTGAFGGVNFVSNLGKLLADDYDITYLNVPGAMYDDVQTSAEYVAYATNYLAALTSRSDVAIIGWSQGNLATQWVFQYWPSTRSVVDDFISISADFHGTTLAYFLSPTLPVGRVIPNPPSILQQQYSSNFVRTLREDGGYAPYVPSTSIWSITDEIVQPQYDPFASAAYFSQELPENWPSTSSTSQGDCNNKASGSRNRTNVPAYTNTQIQTTCQGRPAGGFYPHEGVLYVNANPPQAARASANSSFIEPSRVCSHHRRSAKSGTWACGPPARPGCHLR